VAASEHESDLLLVALVRLQSIIEAMYRNISLRTHATDDQRAPTWMYIKSVKSDLEKLWASLPASLQSNTLMILGYQSAELYIFDPSLQKSLFPTSPSNPANAVRLDMLYSSLISTKTLLDSYLIQPVSYSAFSALDLGQLGHGMSNLLKLSVLEEPGWDLAYVRQTMNLSYYFEQIISKFEAVGASLSAMQPVPTKDNFPTGCARAMRRVKNWYEAKVAAEAQTVAGEGTTTEDVLITDDLVGSQFDYLNEAYWLELMGDTSLLPVSGREENETMLEDIMDSVDRQV